MIVSHSQKSGPPLKIGPSGEDPWVSKSHEIRAAPISCGSPVRRLESILQRELQVALLRSRALKRNITKERIGDSCIRIAVTYNVESVEGVEAETNGLIADNAEVLERRQIVVEVTRASYGAVVRGAKDVVGRDTECANAIVDSRSETRSRRRVSAEPILIGAAYDLQFAVLVGAVGSVAVGVA